MVNTVFFDIGGVLMPDVFDDMCADLGNALDLAPGKIKSMWFQDNDAVCRGVVSEDEALRYMCDEARIAYNPVFRHLLLDSFLKQPLNDELLGLVKQLRGQGFTTAVISNTIPVHVENLKSRGVFADMNHLFLSYEVGLVKPNPAIFRLVADRLGIKPSEAVMIDDLPKNVDAAVSIGMNCIRYIDNRQCKAELGRILDQSPVI